MIVDLRGRLLFTSVTWDGPVGVVLRMDHTDAEPVGLARGITRGIMSPGGLAFDRGMIAGFGGSMPGGLIGNLVGLGDLLLSCHSCTSAGNRC